MSRCLRILSLSSLKVFGILVAEPAAEVAVGCHGSQIEKVSDFAFFDSGNLPK